MSSQSSLEKCCLIGQPVAGNPTHYMIEQALEQAASDWRFLTFEVEPGDLGDAVRGIRALGIRGVKVIAPHRRAVLDLVDEQTPHARLAGSANCLALHDQRLVADDTLGRAVADLLGPAAERRVCLLGAGLAARAIAAGLALAGAADLLIVNRDGEKSAAVAQSISEAAEIEARHGTWPDQALTIEPTIDVLINATTVGTDETDPPLPIATASLRPELTVLDVSYQSPSTWLLQTARQLGCPTIDGLSVLVEQTALALQAWSAIDVDRTTMRDAAEEFLAI